MRVLVTSKEGGRCRLHRSAVGFVKNGQRFFLPGVKPIIYNLLVQSLAVAFLK